LQLITIFILW